MGAIARLTKFNFHGTTHYEIDVTDRHPVDKYLHFPNDFFRELGEANHHKQAAEWDRTSVEKAVREKVGNSVFLVRDLCEELMRSNGLDDTLRHQISNTLQDIGMRNPGETPVTEQNVSELLSAVNIPEHRNQDAFWVQFKEDLLKASEASQGPQLKILLETISQAAERSGLFQAIDTLLTKREFSES